MDKHVATVTATSAATASTGSQKRRGTSGPAVAVPQFPLGSAPCGPGGGGRAGTLPAPEPPLTGRAPALHRTSTPSPAPSTSEPEPDRAGHVLPAAAVALPGRDSPGDTVPAPGVEPPPRTPRAVAAPKPRCHFSTEKPEWCGHSQGPVAPRAGGHGDLEPCPFVPPAARGHGARCVLAVGR
ncbi:unnamed protein product [Coccothraustes coccothraustes]